MNFRIQWVFALSFLISLLSPEFALACRGNSCNQNSGDAGLAQNQNSLQDLDVPEMGQTLDHNAIGGQEFEHGAIGNGSTNPAFANRPPECVETRKSRGLRGLIFGFRNRRKCEGPNGPSAQKSRGGGIFGIIFGRKFKSVSGY